MAGIKVRLSQVFLFMKSLWFLEDIIPVDFMTFVALFKNQISKAKGQREVRLRLWVCEKKIIVQKITDD